MWLYLASELSLKLHGSQSYHAFPRVLRSGGLIDALGPQLGGRKTSHPETHVVTLSCPGFNRKNDYDRQSPCDQGFLRKFARDTQVGRLHAWFNQGSDLLGFDEHHHPVDPDQVDLRDKRYQQHRCYKLVSLSRTTASRPSCRCAPTSTCTPMPWG